MDKIAKALKKLSAKECEKLKSVLTKLESGTANNLDIKKLKDRNDIYRVRVGEIRVIFRQSEKGIVLLKVSRRNEKTYKK